MNESTRVIIETALRADSTVTSEDRRRISTALMPSSEAPIKLITTKMACNLLDCSRRTLYSWEQQGKIRAIRRSKRSIRFNLQDIKTLMLEGASEQKEAAQ